MEIRIGCCGWSALRPQDFAPGDWRQRFRHRLQLYAAHFPLVEVNSTFYKLPRLSTAAAWRALADEVRPTFEFTLKVHQDVTHTDRFRGEVAREAFRRSAEVARALRAKVLLLQCPASFGPTPENTQALRRFLAEVPRDGFVLVWEPRGAWEREPEKVREICEAHDLVHCTDPFRARPVRMQPFAYLRLHGAPPGTRMYRYTYTDADLRWLREQVLRLETDLVYVLFNNDTMAQDARRFRALWEG
ncbi:MAG: DUF72 domain-containing protein [Candidatus Bipolaricaulota bacterium]|nr:DUF72 domain-containing protein [Candidatus Bipolaricaulota bacterium]MDW8152547.1 DUF72 domain-containing protein [Candidatus Bipolaricaulota bacterium]